MSSRKETSNRSGRPILSWMSRIAGSAKLYIAALLILQMLLGIAGVGFAMFLRLLVNAAVNGSRPAFVRAAVLFTGLVILQIAMQALSRYFEEQSRSTLENRFKNNLFSALLTRDYASVMQTHSGEWMNRLTSDTVVVADGMTQILPNTAGMAIRMIGALAGILWLEPRFLYILIPGGFLLIFFSYAFRRILKTLHRQIQETDGRLRIFLSERLENLLIVRTFAREQQTASQADEKMRQHKAARMRRNHFSNFSNIGFSAAMNGAYVFSAIYCGHGILSGTISYGDFMAILQLVSQIQNPFANISGYLPKYYSMLSSAERLREVESYASDAENERSEEELRAFYQSEFRGLELKDAGFTYRPPVNPAQEADTLPPMPVVLEGLNLTIQKGNYAAFTGPSGCGKSTVLKILMCLYPLEHGTRSVLTVSGPVPLTSAFRRIFAYVPQGNQLMSGSIREIVAFGDRERMLEETSIYSALETACALDFVKQLPEGLDTLLGERGAGLSEGQMQRIAIARAIFSEHPVLLLDEATSSLDEQTEQQLLRNLRAMTDRTVIIVTHRRAALSICDTVIDFGSNSNSGEESDSI